MTLDDPWAEYADAAIGMATYEVLDDDGTYYAGWNSAKCWKIG